MRSGVLVSEEVEPGVRYVEEQSRSDRGLPVRDCFMTFDGSDEAFCMLDVRTFEVRFGGVAIRMEGIGGVETQPQLRRQGWMSKLLTRALLGVSARVSVVAMGDAIPGVYEKHGFVNCVSDREMLVDVHHVLGLKAARPDGLPEPRALVPADLGGMIELYNDAHAERPWTHRRSHEWNKLVPETTWSPGSGGMVLEHGGRVSAYVIFTRPLFGHRSPELRVDEMAARDHASASVLISAMAEMSWQRHQSQFAVPEPRDCVVGRTLMDLGCTLRETHHASGGMMARILHMKPFLQLLEPELHRRCRGLAPASLHQRAFEALMAGTLGLNPATLLRLVAGHWALSDALTRGLSVPGFEDVLHLWFPGSGSHRLPTGHAHRLDRF